MQETLKPSQFAVLDADGTPIHDNEVLKLFRFKPSICKIKVDNSGNLHITQTKRSTFIAAKGRWEKLKT